MIAAAPPLPETGSLLVFSDDWGRHPSSCQHLVRHLLDRYPVTWVNTIGTRAPRLDAATIRRVAEKLGQWRHRRPVSDVADSCSLPQNNRDVPDHTLSGLSVVNPKMWPWFSHRHDRRFNRWLLTQQLTPLIQQMPQPVVGLTTLPITADLPGALPVQRWVYYCVDDFSLWPGLDGNTLRRMDVEMIRQADSLVAVSTPLQAMIAAEGRSSELLTHGVDVNFWNTPAGEGSAQRAALTALASLPRPLIVFWGVIDRRMDTASLLQLSQDLTQGTIVLIGPQQDPDPQILSPANVRCLPPQPIQVLPHVAHEATVLVMPYADLPVTRAMQPLKLKEYMATGKPVVVNQLPSTLEWRDCLDTAENPRQFSQLVLNRICDGIGAFQRNARQRLQQETWSVRAARLQQILAGQ